MNGGDPNLGGAQGNPSTIPPQPSGQNPEPVVAAPAQGISSSPSIPYAASVTPQSPVSSQPSAAPTPNPIAPPNNTSYVDPQLSSQIPSSQSLPIQNSFYQRSFVMAPQDNDDIVLASSAGAKKSFRKKLIGIIAGVLGAIALAALIIWIVGMQSEAASNQSIQDTKTLFNIYANYLLYGTESEEPIGDNLSVWTTNTINQQLSNTDEASRALYFNNLLAKFNAFSESFSANDSIKNKLGDEQWQRANGIVNSASNVINSLVLYSTVPDISAETMIDIYFAEGSTGLTNAVSDTYSPLTESQYNNAIIYGRTKTQLANSTIALYDKYSSLGCINGNVLLEECVTANTSDDINLLQEAISSAINSQNSAKYHLKNDVISLSNATYLAIELGDTQDEK